MLGELENLAKRCMRTTEVAAVDIRVREEQRKPELSEAVAPGTSLVQEAFEEGERFVESSLSCIAAAEGIGSREGISGRELTRVERRLQQGDPTLSLSSPYRQSSEAELRSGQGGRRVRVGAGGFIQLRRALLVAELQGEFGFEEVRA